MYSALTSHPQGKMCFTNYIIVKGYLTLLGAKTVRSHEVMTWGNSRVDMINKHGVSTCDFVLSLFKSLMFCHVPGCDVLSCY